MSHYICTGGCNGRSDTPGTCQTKDCPHYGEPLEKCDCDDGTHMVAAALEPEEAEG